MNEVVIDYLPQLNEAVEELITRSSYHDLVDSLKDQLPHTSEPFVWSRSIRSRSPCNFLRP